MSGRAGHARRAGGLAAESTSPATSGHAIHGIADRDGVDPRYVVEPLTELKGRQQREKGEQKMTTAHPALIILIFLKRWLEAVIFNGLFQSKLFVLTLDGWLVLWKAQVYETEAFFAMTCV